MKAPRLALAFVVLALLGVAASLVLWERSKTFAWAHARLEAELGDLPVDRGEPVAVVPHTFARELALLEAIPGSLPPSYTLASFSRDELEAIVERYRPFVAALDVATRGALPLTDGRVGDVALHARALDSLAGLASVQLRLDRADDAARSLRLQLLLQRVGGHATSRALLDRERLVGDNDVALVSEILASEPSETTCRELSDAFEAAFDPDELEQLFLDERARFLGLAERRWDKTPFEVELFLTGWRGKYVPISSHATLRHATRFVTRLASLAHDVSRARVSEAQELAGEWALPRPGPVPAVFESALDADSRRTLARVALALRIFRLRNGRYPKSLDELAPAVVARVPLDPATGVGFDYTVSGAGFLVWTRGAAKSIETHR